MKKIYIFFAYIYFIFSSITTSAQDSLCIFKYDKTIHKFAINDLDSIYFQCETDSSESKNPVNLWNWGKLNALGFYAGAWINYSRNADGSIANSGIMYFDIPVSDYVGKKMFFGFKCTSNIIALSYGEFYNGNTKLTSPSPVFTKVGQVDKNGYQAYSLTHPSNYDIIPLEATKIRIQWSGANIKELYMGELPYTENVSYKQFIKKSYIWLSGHTKFHQESTATYASTSGVSTINSDESITVSADGYSTIDISLTTSTEVMDKLSGKKGYFNIALETTGTKAISATLYAYNVADGIFKVVNNIPLSIINGEVTMPFDFTDININKLRLILKSAEASNFTIRSFDFANEYITSSDIKIKSELSDSVTEASLLPHYSTLQDAISANANYFIIGNNIWAKVRTGIPIALNECNEHNYYYTIHNTNQVKLNNIKIIDLRGYILDSWNKGKKLSLISHDGWMYFRQDYGKGDKIKVETFLTNLIPHDGIKLDASKIDWLELPETQTLEEKQAKLNSEYHKWYMYDITKLSDFIRFADGSINHFDSEALEFSNYSIFSNNTIYRADGTIAKAFLINPILCNPTHFIIKQNGVVLHEFALKNYDTTMKWGEMFADQGSITYSSNIYAAINFNNGKNITIPVSLPAGKYEFILRSRRYGTNCVDGNLSILSGNIKLGSIALTDNINACGGATSALLVDNSTILDIPSTITELKIQAVCPTTKPFRYGNGYSTIPRWGFMSTGKFGILTEYDSVKKRNGMMYFTKDCGETWEALFDISLNVLTCNIGNGHIHGATIDNYFKQLIIICGDSNFTSGIYHADYSDDISSDNISWKREIGEYPFYGSGNKEQYCSVFAMKDNIIFGSDCAPTGIFRMNRINAEYYTKREPSILFGTKETISHIPTMYNQYEGNTYIISMRADHSPTLRKDLSSIVHTTKDGIYINELWKDNVAHGSFGENNSQCVYRYGKYIFIFFYEDGRFEQDSTLVVGEINN